VILIVMNSIGESKKKSNNENAENELWWKP
jgi:hypothetical protein